MYECKWCGNSYKKANGTQANLYKHWDGNLDWAACASRISAIQAGAKLPMTPKDLEAQMKFSEKGAMSKFLGNGPFDLKVFNQLLIMWLIRYALPWNQIEDFLLEVAFIYVQQGIKLNSWTWAATEAHKLYFNLQGTVVSNLQVSFIQFLWELSSFRKKNHSW